VDADVVVIGAGALGLATALHCAMSGRPVAVVERHTAGSQASGRAAGLFKSVQADELRTRLARRSITKAVTFADWAGTPLTVARPGSYLIARTPQHREFLQRELAQSQRWGVDVREATPAELSYYRPKGDEFTLWCPEDVYIEEPVSLIQACLAACRRHGAVVMENEPVVGIPVTAGRVTGVETSTSIVPRSHSRDRVRDVSCAPTSAITSATTPGMMKSRLTRSSLYQTRYCAIAGATGGCWPRLCVRSSWTLPEKAPTTDWA